MLKQLNTKDKTTAQTILTIQHLAYRIEADLIGFNGIPPLHETIDDILNSEETFIGYYVEDVLAGALSYSVDDAILDIGRLIVHPDYFRRGIAKKLVQSVDTVEGIQKIIVSTGALNHPARRLYEKLGYKLVEEIMLPEGVEIACYEKPL